MIPSNKQDLPFFEYEIIPLSFNGDGFASPNFAIFSIVWQQAQRLSGIAVAIVLNYFGGERATQKMHAGKVEWRDLREGRYILREKP